MGADGGRRCWSRPHCARWKPSCLPKKRGQSPLIFGPSLLWPNGWMQQNATWYGGRPQPRRLCVRWDPAPTPKWADPKFSAHVYCSQTAAWIKMPLGTEVGAVGPGHIVPNGWMDEDTACRPRPRPHCTRRGPSSLESGTAPPSFRPMFIVATVAHLSYC